MPVITRDLKACLVVEDEAVAWFHKGHHGGETMREQRGGREHQGGHARHVTK